MPWVKPEEQTPEELTLLALAYLEKEEEDLAPDWFYCLGYYDNRGFWMNQEEKVMPTPARYCVVTTPK